jgi:hypothetical protein
MHKTATALAIIVIVVMAIVAIVQVARGQSPGVPSIPGEYGKQTQGENVREVTAPSVGNSPEAPDISFIDSPTSTCYHPDFRQDTCYLNWYYLSVDAGSPNYMIAMTVTLNTIGTIARFNGFFQQSMYAPFNMFGDGFKVACGPLGAGGSPTLGNAYSWTIRAKASDNLSSANYGTTYCPAYIP